MSKRSANTAAVAVIAIAALALTACGSSSSGKQGGSGPIQIGVIMPLTGALGAGADQAKLAFTAAKNAINAKGGVLGRQVSFVVEDDQGTPAGSATAVQSLAGKGIHLTVGGGSTPECQGIVGVLQRVETVNVATGCITDSFTGAGVNPLFYRVNAPASALAAGLGTVACKQFPTMTTVDELNVSGQLGDAQSKAMGQAMSKACNVKVGTNLSVSGTTSTTAPYVAQLNSALGPNSKQSTVLSLEVYPLAMGDFLKIAPPTGIIDKYAGVITYSIQSLESNLVKTPAPFNIYGAFEYNVGMDTPTNAAFITAYKAVANGAMPNTAAGVYYNSALAMFAAITKANSTDEKAVSNALAGLTFTGLQSDPVTIDKTTHQGNPALQIIEYTGSTSKILGSIPYPTTTG